MKYCKGRFTAVLTGCLLLLQSAGYAQTNPLWLRYPAISPDGKKVAFGYKGDIYLVGADGGVAAPITIHEAHDMMPVWSHDGKYIAFASDRHGNFDVYVMPATGGTPVRLTYNSSGDFPYDFSADDKHVIFGSARNAPSQSVRFSTLLFKNLYSVNVNGGRPMLISAAGIENAHYNSNGTSVVFQDTKGYEDKWRKHHTSSVTKDIWMLNLKDKTYQKISDFQGEDREPLFSSDDQYVYYLSEKKGTQNIFRKTLVATGAEEQLTSFKDNPVRHLSRANDNTLCFSQDGEVYTLKEGGSPKKLSVQIINDGRGNVERNVPISGGMTEFALSPNGKEIAFVARGEVFVTSVEGAKTKRITNTPQQERMIQWAPDGRTLIYAGERKGNWDIYKTTITRKDEPYFFAATVLKEEPVIATEADEFLPKYSPDGKEIAYIEERNILKVHHIESKKTKVILPEGRNYSYADGDWGFQWSPDSKWLIVDDQRGYWLTNNAALIKVSDPDTIIHPINSGFGEGNTKWALNGKLMTWISNREGRKSLANQGSSEVDVYGVFFDKDTYEKYIISKEEYALLKEKEEKEEKEEKDKDKGKEKDKDKKSKGLAPEAKDAKDSKDNKDAPKTDKKDAVKELKLDLSGLENRKIRLTINSSSLSDYILNQDGSKLFYLASFEKGYDLWVTEPRTHDTKILAKLGGSPSGIEMSSDGKSLFVANNGSLVKIDAETGAQSPIAIHGEMVVAPEQERNYIFEHAWGQVRKKFYDPKFEGVNWPFYKTVYAKFLPHINNNYDFQELLSEMLGELNASHTGGSYRPPMHNSDNTACLGLFYDETHSGEGLKIAEVIVGGPLDNASSKVKAGHIIEKIDGVAITDDMDWARLLNLKTKDNTLLSIYDPASNKRWDETVKPISLGEESGLLYKRWVNKMSSMVDKLSGGKVGYVHVQGMNDGSFREVYDVVLGKNLDKDALIVDTRFNGGGWLHDDLNTFLSGKRYLDFAPQGHHVKGSEPGSRWQKPSCVLMSESNYSDAFIFPYSYKQLGIGKLIGMPVPGTGTAVWWETQIDPTIVFGIPMIATIGKEKRPTENLQVEPDIRVPLKYEEFLNGKDAQLEAAVAEMLKQTK